MKKIRLERPRRSAWAREHWRDNLIITSAPPYVYSNHCSRAHRVRSAMIHNLDSTSPHASYQCWCGQHVLQSSKSRDKYGKVVTLTDKVPKDLPVCATCEGRAIGAGQDQSKTINGREVIFSPRKERK